MKLISWILLWVFPFFSGASITPKNWTTHDKGIYWGKKKIAIRGLSWFGFETQDYVVNGLWNHGLEFYFGIMKQIGINAIRVPFSSDWIYYNWDLYPYDGIISADPSIQHLKSVEILDRFFDLAEENGMMILLDLHRLNNGYISELWYDPNDNRFTSDTFFSTWFRILDRYIDRPNLMGIDLINEPHGQANWGSGNPSNDWKLFVEYAVPKILDRYPSKKFLVFIEGVNWGHTFSDYRNHVLDLPDDVMDRIVFSPHVYGQSVVPGTTTDPYMLTNQWNYDFGFMASEYGKAVVPGEWGGKTDIDANWMSHFGNYCAEMGFPGNFFWSLGPNSGDVAGLLLDDWTTLDQFKVSVMNTMVPNSTIF